MAGGYLGKVLFVDLTRRSIREEFLPEKMYRDFIGGIGLGARILYEHVPAKIDPLGPENMLGFVTGPLTATPVPTTGRCTVVAKSPKTGAWGDSNIGGYLGAELKTTGYDAVFFSGAASQPVYLWLSSNQAEIRDASDLWGRDTAETEDQLRDQLGDAKARIACIGPAGEMRSLIAGIVTEKGRVAARAGVGAVMGSKKLKAIALRGERKVPVARSKELSSLRESYLKTLKANPFQQMLAKTGTGASIGDLVPMGDTAIKNWLLAGTEAMPTHAQIDFDEEKLKKYRSKKFACSGCPIACGAIFRLPEGGNEPAKEVHRPEYQTMAAFGPLCLNDDEGSIIRANDLCNRYGIDTISAGTTIAFAMECYERGLIGPKETEGIELQWGNARAIIEVLEKMARREGFGAILADGVKKAAERIGKDSEEWAMHVHGQEIAFHDTRFKPTYGTLYMVDANPGRHVVCGQSGMLEIGAPLGSDPALLVPKLDLFGDYDKKGPMYIVGHSFNQLIMSSGLCSLASLFVSVPIAEFISCVTGWNFSWGEGVKTGQRILTLRQAFNAREGILPEDFRLPRRVAEPAVAGPAKGVQIDFETLKKGYFNAMWWDQKTGRPYPKAMMELGLYELTRDLTEDSRGKGESRIGSKDHWRFIDAGK